METFMATAKPKTASYPRSFTTKPENEPVIPQKNRVYILKSIDSSMCSDYRSDFKYPEEGFVFAPDWSPNSRCGYGLHGYLHGMGDYGHSKHEHTDKWLVIEADSRTVIKIDSGKVKIPYGYVRYCGDVFGAFDFMKAKKCFSKLPKIKSRSDKPLVVTTSKTYATGTTVISDDSHNVIISDNVAIALDNCEQFVSGLEVISLGSSNKVNVKQYGSAIVRGYNSQIRTRYNCDVVVLAEECYIQCDEDCNVYSDNNILFKARYGSRIRIRNGNKIYNFQVDGNKIKEDVLYTLNESTGKLIKVA
jgi:hypothetical protein